jgi:hypothetical protein
MIDCYLGFPSCAALNIGLKVVCDLFAASLIEWLHVGDSFIRCKKYGLVVCSSPGRNGFLWGSMTHFMYFDLTVLKH